MFVHNLWLLYLVGPEPPSASIVCIKRTRRICSCCRRAKSLYPLECRLFRPAQRAPSVDNLPLPLFE